MARADGQQPRQRLPLPGCGRTHWTNIHHIVHWACGGETDLENLIKLCVFHHRMLHNDGWGIRGNPNGDVEWVHPNGWVKRATRRLPAWDDAIEHHLDFVDSQYQRRLAAALG